MTSPFTQLWKQDELKREAEKQPTPTPTPPTTSTLPTPTPPTTTHSISPERNFTKVANSIKPELFKGTSQKTYMALYKLTRGAIVPKRTIKITRNDLMTAADVSEVTLVKHLTYLEKILRLVKKTAVLGDNGGATYEVFLPEEIGLDLGLPTPTPPTPTPNSIPTFTQKLDAPAIKKVGVGGVGNLVDNKGAYEENKTSSKTLKYIDDEAPVVDVLEKLSGMARKLTGKGLSKKDLEILPEIIEMLVSETVIAAARTGSVTAPIAFMKENLRRRLYSKPRPAGKKEARPKYLDVRKGTEDKNSQEIAWTPQTSLNSEQRENTLNALKEARDADGIFFREFKTYGEIEYTSEDFKWLIENLGKGSD